MNIIIIYKNINKFSDIFSIQWVYKSVQRKNQFSPSALNIYLLGGLVVMVAVLGINLVYGQLMQTSESLLYVIYLKI